MNVQQVTKTKAYKRLSITGTKKNQRENSGLRIHENIQ